MAETGAIGNVVVDIATDQLNGQLEKFKNARSWRDHFFNGLALVAVGSAAAAFIIEGGLLVTAVSAVCAFLGPCAALQQQRLADLQEMRILHQKLRAEVTKFQTQNVTLRQENETMAKSVKKLRESEKDLKELVKLDTKNVNIMMKQVQEFRKIQEDIKESLEAKVIQNLIEVVIHSDDDQDFILDKNEVDGLLTRLGSIEGVDFSEENFKLAIMQAGFKPEDVLDNPGGFSLSAVMEVVKNLLDDDVPAEDNIFTIHTEQLLPKKRR